jgi:hypothetical protein
MYEYNVIMSIISTIFGVIGGLTVYGLAVYWVHDKASKPNHEFVKDIFSFNKKNQE